MNLKLQIRYLYPIDKDRTVLLSLEKFNEFSSQYDLSFANGEIKIMIYAKKRNYAKNLELI